MNNMNDKEGNGTEEDGIDLNIIGYIESHLRRHGPLPDIDKEHPEEGIDANTKAVWALWHQIPVQDQRLLDRLSAAFDRGFNAGFKAGYGKDLGELKEEDPVENALGDRAAGAFNEAFDRAMAELGPALPAPCAAASSTAGPQTKDQVKP